MIILVFGDSVGYGMDDSKGGWVRRLRDFSTARNGPRIYNLSVSGDNTEKLLKRLGEEAKLRMAGSETVIIIAVGVNDTHVEERLGHSTVPQTEFNANINFMTKLAPQTATQYNSTSSYSELVSNNIAYQNHPKGFSACFVT